eukprot:TRINITY_DN655_c1_g1_i3.p3 TRINITY_DN655_c1_g1~~TRINITY_DN655_c1_g1_i3.p3  ORF type:complete len:223 (-),score=52.83 TRINITY_DN655_c1_g1_i3:113-781(-)
MAAPSASVAGEILAFFGLAPSRLRYAGAIGSGTGGAAAVVRVPRVAVSVFWPESESGWTLGAAGTRAALWAALSESERAAPRNVVVFNDRDPASSANGGRFVDNGAEVAAAVGGLVAQLGRGLEFVWVREPLPFRAMVALFRRALVVFGPHGAQAHHVLACGDGAAVVEFLPPGMRYASVWSVAAQLGLRYWAVPVAGATMRTNMTLPVGRLVDHVTGLLDG